MADGTGAAVSCAEQVFALQNGQSVPQSDALRQCSPQVEVVFLVQRSVTGSHSGHSESPVGPAQVSLLVQGEPHLLVQVPVVGSQ